MGAGEEGRSPTAASAEAHSGARGDEGGIREGSAGTKAGAGKAGTGKAAAVPPHKAVVTTVSRRDDLLR